MTELYELVERQIDDTALQNKVKDIAEIAYKQGKIDQMVDELKVREHERL